MNANEEKGGDGVTSRAICLEKRCEFFSGHFLG
jgi:hypothetical protein